MKKITDKMRLDWLSKKQKATMGGFYWVQYQVNDREWIDFGLRKSIDSAIRAEAKKKGKG